MFNPSICVSPLVKLLSEEVLRSLETLGQSKNLQHVSLRIRHLSFPHIASVLFGCFRSTTIKELEVDRTVVGMISLIVVARFLDMN